MTDRPDIAQTPEAVAYALLNQIKTAENIKTPESSKKYLLDTYAECLEATKGRRPTA